MKWDKWQHKCFELDSTDSMNFLCRSEVKNPLVNAEDVGLRVQFLGQENSLEKEMATHSSIVA